MLGSAERAEEQAAQLELGVMHAEHAIFVLDRILIQKCEYMLEHIFGRVVVSGIELVGAHLEPLKIGGQRGRLRRGLLRYAR